MPGLADIIRTTLRQVGLTATDEQVAAIVTAAKAGDGSDAMLAIIEREVKSLLHETVTVH